eukprot:8425329-Prorocentrum_lima.AAC.1
MASRVGGWEGGGRVGAAHICGEGAVWFSWAEHPVVSGQCGDLGGFQPSIRALADISRGGTRD